jgi:hypothetical protein
MGLRLVRTSLFRLLRARTRSWLRSSPRQLDQVGGEWYGLTDISTLCLARVWPTASYADTHDRRDAISKRLVLWIACASPALGEVGLRGSFVLMWCDFVRVDAHHEVRNMIVDLGKPVSRAGRNDHDVSRLEFVDHAIANGAGTVAGTVQ